MERTVRHHPYRRVNRGPDGGTPSLPKGVGLSEPPSLRERGQGTIFGFGCTTPFGQNSVKGATPPWIDPCERIEQHELTLVRLSQIRKSFPDPVTVLNIHQGFGVGSCCHIATSKDTHHARRGSDIACMGWLDYYFGFSTRRFMGLHSSHASAVLSCFSRNACMSLE